MLTTAWVAGELHECAAVHAGSYHSHTHAVLSQISQRVALEQSRARLLPGSQNFRRYLYTIGQACRTYLRDITVINEKNKKYVIREQYDFELGRIVNSLPEYWEI